MSSMSSNGRGVGPDRSSLRHGFRGVSRPISPRRRHPFFVGDWQRGPLSRGFSSALSPATAIAVIGNEHGSPCRWRACGLCLSGANPGRGGSPLRFRCFRRRGGDRAGVVPLRAAPSPRAEGESSPPEQESGQEIVGSSVVSTLEEDRGGLNAGAIATPPSPSRTQAYLRVASFLGVAAEFALQGSLLWSPIAIFVIFAITKARSKVSMLRQGGTATTVVGEPCSIPGLLSTQSESPAWMAVMIDTLWPAFERIIAQNVIRTVQIMLDRKLPTSLALQVNRFYLGKSAPRVENFRAAFHDPVGTMELLECDLTIDSNDLAIVISGKAPVVGKVFVKMHDFDLKGTVQLWVVPDERLFLVAFKSRPDIVIEMSVKAATRTIDFKGLLCQPIEQVLRESVRELVQERRRILIPLEVEQENTGRMAVDGEVKIQLLSCSGLPNASETSRYQVIVKNAVLEVERRSRIKGSSLGEPTWKQQKFRFRTGDAVGIFVMTVQDLTSGQHLGMAILYAAALPDGCTAFWSADRYGRPIAKRWLPRSGPFRITMPLEDPKTFQVQPEGEITVEVSTLRWLYKQDLAPPSRNFRSQGPRSVIVRVLEAHNIGGIAGDVSLSRNLFVQVIYNAKSEETQAVHTNTHPVWNRTFVFQENPSIQTREIRLKVLNKGALDSSMGFTTVNLDSVYEGQALDSWIELGGTPSGRLHVVAEIVPGLADSKEVQDRASEAWVPETPYLNVEIVSGTDLPAADLDGSSDPYVVVRFGTAATQTPVIPKNLNPKFNHKAILPLCLAGTQLRVECWDYDFLRKDDQLGSASLDVSSIVKNAGEEYPVTLKLSGDKGPGKHGSLLIKLTRVGEYKDIPKVDPHASQEEDTDGVNLLLNSMAEPPFIARI